MSRLEINLNSPSIENLSEYELVDIRHPDKVSAFPICACKSVNIPYYQFGQGDHQLEKDGGPYLLCCDRGQTSLAIVGFLFGRGYRNVYSLKDGYEALCRLQN